MNRASKQKLPDVVGLHRNFCSVCGREFYTVDESGPDLVCPDCFWETLFSQVRGGR